MDDFTDVTYEVGQGPPATITINRPERYNAFRAQTVDELIKSFKRAWVSDEVGVVCLTGAGTKAFCAGGDQKQRAETGDYGPSDSGLFEIDSLHRVIRDIPKPTIAAVNGVAIGGGARAARAVRPHHRRRHRDLRAERPACRLVRRRPRLRATWPASSARSAPARSGSCSRGCPRRRRRAGGW